MESFPRQREFTVRHIYIMTGNYFLPKDVGLSIVAVGVDGVELSTLDGGLVGVGGIEL